MQGDFFNNGIGDWFISDQQKHLNQAIVDEAKVQDEQNQTVVDYMKTKTVAGSSNVGNTDEVSKSTYLILAGVSFVFLFTIVMVT
jgi:ABC-type Na+ efflux pump permease subunit